ncbi:hypothetical protein EV363DRAFT_76481 [Boletus edulis]|nr:hypothetical protein EV363DRAFT_76481 [Boletus edulis]
MTALILSIIQDLPHRAHWMSPVHTGASQTSCDRHANDGGGDGPDLSPQGTRRGANLRIAYALRARTLRIHFERSCVVESRVPDSDNASNTLHEVFPVYKHDIGEAAESHSNHPSTLASGTCFVIITLRRCTFQFLFELRFVLGFWVGNEPRRCTWRLLRESDVPQKENNCPEQGSNLRPQDCPGVVTWSYGLV